MNDALVDAILLQAFVVLFVVALVLQERQVENASVVGYLQVGEDFSQYWQVQLIFLCCDRSFFSLAHENRRLLVLELSTNLLHVVLDKLFARGIVIISHDDVKDARLFVVECKVLAKIGTECTCNKSR
jgi:hypothetical protein